MLKSYSTSKEQLNNLKYQLNDNEKKLKKSIVNKGKYLKDINYTDGVFIGVTGLANGLVNHWDKFNNSQLKEYAIAIAKNSDRVISLVNNMLDLAHLNYKNFSLNLTTINIIQLLKAKFEKHETYKNFQKQISFVSRVDKNVTVSCDKYFINRSLDNLISSIMSSSRINYIEIKLESSKDSAETKNEEYLQIIINYDTTEEIKLLFNKAFNRRPAILDSNFNDFKLEFNEDIGLILVKQVIEHHKGKIRVENYNKKIENIIFTLPICCI